MSRAHAPLEDRLWRRVDVGHPLGCWEWTGAKSLGYGVIGLGRRVDGNDFTHRVAWRLLMGEIPDGMHLDHLCRNRACVNVDHLEVVTPAENKRRGFSPAALHARMKQCKRGHNFDRVRANGSRACSTCERSWRENRRAA